jgi:hypothetical protein
LERTPSGVLAGVLVASKQGVSGKKYGHDMAGILT